MTRNQAIKKILKLKNADEIDTTIWEAMGFPFEKFLRFAQFDKAHANQNLKNLQYNLRKQMEEQ